MYAALILIAVGALALIVFGCVQIVVGGRDADIKTDAGSKFDRKIEINSEEDKNEKKDVR